MNEPINWTPEPWFSETCPHGAECWCRVIYGTPKSEDDYVAPAGSIGWENARRIIACVNFCMGIPTEKLEKIFKESND